MGYAGESIAKKVARALMYREVARRLGSRRGTANVIALCGPEGRDLDPLFAFGIVSKPEQVLLVDIERSGLDAAQAKVPGVLTHHGPMHESTPPWPVDVAVFDWCGHADSEMARLAYARIGRVMRKPGALIAATYIRGRERADAPSRHLLDRYGRKLRMYRPERWDKEDNETKAMEILRMASVSSAVAKATTGDFCGGRMTGVRDSAVVCTGRGHIRYSGHAAPMAIDIFQLVRAHEVRRIEAAEEIHPVGRCDIRLLLGLARVLDNEGVPAARALSMRPARLAAFRAHHTMGTYNKAAA